MLKCIQGDILKVKWLKRHSVECFFLLKHAIFVGDVHKIKVTKRK
ncbi:hypothetical protein bcere0029_45530 [Bacillus cereus AH1272]|nr:hypothetical protein bcere0029_45530 [Bacillus cereus AH1272]EEL91480.1 hypothetical protein bcere0030_45380 [Bacillus cereus AH1273]EOP49576.1 hypothetical protein IKQ_04385 [Bacillus cereus VDM053]